MIQRFNHSPLQVRGGTLEDFKRACGSVRRRQNWKPR